MRVFTSLGDSRTPLYFLIGSSIGNILLDYIFVAIFHWDVAGVAWATFIAQGIAGILALYTLIRRLKAIEEDGPYEKFSWSMLSKIAAMAVPSILQQSSISVGNMFIQSFVNSFGSSVIAGYSAAIKLNTFTITSFTTLGNSISNFTSQNLGAGKAERIGAGLRAGIRMAYVIALPFFVLFFFAGNQMLSMFMNEESVLAAETGKTMLKIISPFYFVISIKLVTDGVLRGASHMREFMVSTFTDLLLRVFLSFILSRAFLPFGATGIWMSWPIGWTIATLMSLWYYFSISRR